MAQATMELLPSLTITLASAGVAIYVLLLIRNISYAAFQRLSHKTLAFPPGPSPLPIVGNYFDIPKTLPWLGYRDLAAKYGDIISVRMLGRVLVVINSVEIARDLLEKRSAIYSSRPDSVMLKVCGWEWHVAFMPCGQAWRTHRRVLWQHFHPGVVTKFQPFQMEGARRLLPLLLHEPAKLSEHIRCTIGAALTRTTYGLPSTDSGGLGDKYTLLAEKAASSLKLFSSTSILEIIPGLAHIPTWFPGTGVLRHYADIRRIVRTSRDLPWADAQAIIDSVNIGQVSNSLTSILLEDLPHIKGNGTESQEFICRDITGAIYSAALDSTHASLSAFFLAMAMFPDVQRKAQVELHTVVGPSRLPDFSDRNKLPYINAIVKETLRWHTVGPLGLMHASISDDIYLNHFIPKGALVAVNAWSILHNPETFPDPDVFKPERFLKDGQINREMLDPEDIAFGFGRRICPGRHYATSTMFIYMASILHTLRISPALAEDGRPVPVGLRPMEGLVMHVEPCMLTIEPRSRSTEALVREAAAATPQAELSR